MNKLEIQYKTILGVFFILFGFILLRLWIIQVSPYSFYPRAEAPAYYGDIGK